MFVLFYYYYLKILIESDQEPHDVRDKGLKNVRATVYFPRLQHHILPCCFNQRVIIERRPCNHDGALRRDYEFDALSGFVHLNNTEAAPH